MHFSGFHFAWMIHILPFLTVDQGVLHKSVVFERDVHIVEEIQLLKNSESVKNLLLSSEVSPKKREICLKLSRYEFLLGWENSQMGSC